MVIEEWTNKKKLINEQKMIVIILIWCVRKMFYISNIIIIFFFLFISCVEWWDNININIVDAMWNIIVSRRDRIYKGKATFFV